MTAAPEGIIVVGAGGFGREVLDVVVALNEANLADIWNVVGVVDDSPSFENLRRLEARGVRYLGTFEDLIRAGSACAIAIGVGSPKARRQMSNRLARRSMRRASLIHPTAVIGTEFKFGEGLVICATASVGTNVEFGRDVHLNPHAVVGHDSVLGDYVSLNPRATISGTCSIEENVLVGASALVLQGLRVGSGATVGAGACVTKPVSSHATVVGVPAREMRNEEGPG